MNRIEVYTTTQALRNRSEGLEVDAIESEAVPGTVIVRSEEEWAIVQRGVPRHKGVTVRIPAGLINEIAEWATM